MARHRISVYLTDEEVKFVKWMADRDKVTFQRELWMFFNVEFEQCKELYMDEMKMEEQA